MASGKEGRKDSKGFDFFSGAGSGAICLQYLKALKRIDATEINDDEEMVSQPTNKTTIERKM